jgi:hypothetical protein
MMGEGINDFLLSPHGDTSALEKHAKQINKKYGTKFESKKNSTGSEQLDKNIVNIKTSTHNTSNSSINKKMKITLGTKVRDDIKSSYSINTDRNSVFGAGQQ